MGDMPNELSSTREAWEFPGPSPAKWAFLTFLGGVLSGGVMDFFLLSSHFDDQSLVCHKTHNAHLILLALEYPSFHTKLPSQLRTDRGELGELPLKFSFGDLILIF